MAIASDIKKTVSDATPVYAVVGVTDLAAEKLREARTQAVAARESLAAVHPKALQKSVQHDLAVRAGKARKQVEEAPALVVNKTLELAGKAQAEYDAFAARGERLVERIRTQKATQDLVAQAEQTISIGKGAVTTVRKAVADTQSSAKATVTTGRHQAARVADVVSGVVVREAKDARVSVVESVSQSVETVAETTADVTADAAKRTRTAGKRTRTTASKGAKASTARTKATATSARKSAPRARKATEAAAAKVGA